MSASKVKVSIPFDSLVETVSKLSLENKYQLWELLEEQIAEQDATVRAEIQEARDAYQSGDYLTIQDYVSKYHKKS